MTYLKNQKALISHYKTLLETHGDSPKALQWRDAETQLKRFEILCEIANPINSVLDVGCGLAHLYHHLKSTGFTGRYRGVEIVPEFVELAASNLKDEKNASVDLTNGLAPLPEGMDYVLLSGAFNNLQHDNKGFMQTMLRQMFNAAQKGISFNAMSTYVDFHNDTLYYADPMDVFKFCKQELGGHPVLRHDYSLSENGYPYEFTMYVYKQPGC